jgi:threonine/homoserine/homoserine lactone efflux protein
LTQSLLTISIIGLIAGFIFSMPIAGPISILVTSNALKGKLKYCNILALGASFSDFIYVLVAVYGITHLFSYYKQVIPYILGVGSFFILYMGIRIIRTKLDLTHIDEEQKIPDIGVKKRSGALYTGFMINFLNPTLFFGWLISSFIVLSFAASLGFNTSGLENVVDQNLNQIEKIDGKALIKPQIPSYLQMDTLKIFKKENLLPKEDPKHPVSMLLISLFYAFFLSIGSILWFFVLALLLVRFRKKIDINIINWVVRGLGVILCLFAIFFGYSALKMLF